MTVECQWLPEDSRLTSQPTFHHAHARLLLSSHLHLRARHIAHRNAHALVLAVPSHTISLDHTLTFSSRNTCHLVEFARLAGSAPNALPVARAYGTQTAVVRTARPFFHFGDGDSREGGEGEGGEIC